METKTAPLSPQYLQIARDLAGRIARGDFAEGSRIYGRSLIASEYKVSPETIRRALRLLADRKVVEVRPQSGVVVLSADSARRCVESFGEYDDARALQEELLSLMQRQQDLLRRTAEVTAALARAQSAFSSSAPLPNYEVPVPENSPLLGKSIGEVMFWQHTGATIVAIRRGPAVILSPGPYAELYVGDVLLVAGAPAAAEAAARLVSVKEEKQA